MCKDLYLLRHGQSTWNASRRHQGQLESRLTELGRQQARAMGAVLAREIATPADYVAFASPLARAWETAEIALGPLGLVPRPDIRLKEIMLGAWQGLTDREIFARFPWAEAPREADPFRWNFMAPGGETLPMMATRLRGFLDHLDDRPAVIVAHGMALRVLRGLCLGLDVQEMQNLPGGQGVVWRLQRGTHAVLTP